MRAALWLLALFGIASAVALFAGNNEGTITVFWPPTRVDLSLNLVLALLVVLFVGLHFALRALSALFSLPRQARQWRLQQKERNLHVALFDAMAQLLAGRFTRARKSAQAALAQERTLAALDAELPHARQLRVMAHLMAAESAQSLQDHASRDAHLQHALNDRDERGAPSLLPELREGLQLRSARWALEGRDPSGALSRLAELPVGAQRRTLALRLRLKAARQAQRTQEALDTARLLAKHRAFSPAAAQTIVRGLVSEWINAAHDSAQLLRIWNELDPGERVMPEIAIQAAQRMVQLGGDLEIARAWLLPVWERVASAPDALGDAWRVKLVQVLEAGFDEVDADWLARIESAHQRHPRDPLLQYLAGMVCLKRQLWGKAQQHLSQAARGLSSGPLARRAWVALARMAQSRGDATESAQAWQRAALADLAD
ncbi:MAG: heme biosynthesis protein HemY [Comamonadaceae bacterium]|nr:MAG: heme biosynthesis protein HemY [Comamonadaceae bacterium]